MFYVRARSPSVITFITLDLRTNSKALLKQINNRISEEEKALQIIFMSVPHKLNQASSQQPGLSVCLSAARLAPSLRRAEGVLANPHPSLQTSFHEPSSNRRAVESTILNPETRWASSTPISTEPGRGGASSAPGAEHRRTRCRMLAPAEWHGRQLLFPRDARPLDPAWFVVPLHPGC